MKKRKPAPPEEIDVHVGVLVDASSKIRSVSEQLDDLYEKRGAELLWLREHSDLTMAQLAELTGVTDAAISVQISKARDRSKPKRKAS